jgi:hypothetical protein
MTAAAGGGKGLPVETSRGVKPLEGVWNVASAARTESAVSRPCQTMNAAAYGELRMVHAGSAF